MPLKKKIDYDYFKNHPAYEQNHSSDPLKNTLNPKKPSHIDPRKNKIGTLYSRLCPIMRIRSHINGRLYASCHCCNRCLRNFASLSAQTTPRWVALSLLSGVIVCFVKTTRDSKPRTQWFEWCVHIRGKARGPL